MMWFKATSRKPKEWTDVLCTDGGTIWIGYYITKKNRDVDSMEDGWYAHSTSFMNDHVVYWQYLPKLPKED